MKELQFLEIINNELSDSAFIGDDCAHLKDLGIVVTQDTLVEDIHFSLNYSTPFQLGYKSVMVNLSDIFASGAVPKYITISLSLPKGIKDDFVKDFYTAVNDLSNEYEFEVIGGDLTGSEKIMISICAIGTTKDCKISSRSHAKVGDYVVITGLHGSSAAGLAQLQKKNKTSIELINAHLTPIPQSNFSYEISTKTKRDYAMMDTSDGLVDALYKIAKSSDKLISVDFDKIPYDKEIKSVAKDLNVNFQDWVLYGGEDYQLIACLDEENLKNIKTDYKIIGKVKEKKDSYFVEINFDDKIEKITDLEKTFNHFKD